MEHAFLVRLASALAGQDPPVVLVLDDFGSGRINELQRECLLGVVDERWANGRPIIVTFNAESLRDMVGERIASRLAHGVTAVAFAGDDRRRSS